MIENLLEGFKVSLSLYNLFYCTVGCILGMVVGVLPGLGPSATIALLLSLTYHLDVTSGIIMLSGIWYGSMYGGTITSVLLKIPGEPSSVVTILEGHKMALRGEAGKALGIAAFGSFIAGTFGTIMIGAMAVPLSGFAIMFGPAEYTTLMVLGLNMVIYLGSGSAVKAMLMGALGLAFSVIGMDEISGLERFTFGSTALVGGIDLPIIAMGLFGISEVLLLAEGGAARSARDTVKCPSRLRELLPDVNDWKRSILPIIRGTLLGFTFGLIPGGGATISSFASYALENKLSKNPIPFGEGAIEGVAGPEASNNAASSGMFIPLLTLGIPTNAVMALLLGAFMIHGVIPGPLLLVQNPGVFWGLITSMYIGNVILLILSLPLIGFFVKIIEVPVSVLSPLIIVVCVIGAFSIENSATDILIVSAFGVVGYLMKKADFPPAPLILGCVLGRLLEKSFRQSLIMSHGSLAIFIERPIARVFAVSTILILFIPLVTAFLRKRRLTTVFDKIKELDSESD
jgi:putative tricarboxylic transport membrane protein